MSKHSSLSTPLLARLWRAAVEPLAADLERKQGAKADRDADEMRTLRPAESGAMPIPNLGIPPPHKENKDIIYNVNMGAALGNAPGSGEGRGAAPRVL